VKIKHQLLLGFLAVVAVFGAAGATSWRELRSIEESNGRVARETEIHRLAVAYQRAAREIQVGAYLVTQDDRSMGRQLIASGRAAMTDSRARLQTLVRGVASERVKELGRLADLAQQAVAAVTARAEAGGDAKLIARDLRFLEARVEALTLLVSIFTDEAEEALSAALDAARVSERRTSALIIGSIATALVVGVLIALWVSRRIAAPIRRFTDVAERVSVGEIAHEVSANGASKEIAELGVAFGRMLNSFKVMEAMLKEDAEEGGRRNVA
jgi:methyl-accepting chemotaxis protein